MPVDVYKALRSYVRHVQVRRIQCEHCDRPFCYLCVDTKKIEEVTKYGHEHDLERAAVERARKLAGSAARKARRGEALCPHCKRYQGRMIVQSHIRTMTRGLARGVLVGIFATLLWLILVSTGAVGNIRDMQNSTLQSLVFVAPLILSVLVGVGLGKLRAIKSGQHDGEDDPRSYDDDTFVALVSESQGKGDDPIESWYLTVLTQAEYPVQGIGHMRPGSNYMFASLGFNDMAEPPLSLPALDAPAAT